MQIIGIAGAAGSGKDTAYALLSDHIKATGLVCAQLSFADKIKDTCASVFGWDRQRLVADSDYKEGNTLDDGSPDPACELLGMTRRKVMQLLGTEAMRNGLHQDVWIITMKLAILRGEFEGIDVGFVTDCRFLNELQFVRDLDGVLFQINRTGDQSTLTTETEHLSELEWRQWTDWDAIVENNIVSNQTGAVSMVKFHANLVHALDVAWRSAPKVAIAV